jgi:hypothetical protein
MANINVVQAHANQRVPMRDPTPMPIDNDEYSAAPVRGKDPVLRCERWFELVVARSASKYLRVGSHAG